MGEWKEKYLQLWEKLTKRQRYMAIGGVALLLVVILAASFMYGGKPDMVPLFTNMETKDAGEVVRMYTVGTEKVVNSFVMVAAEGPETTFICLDGQMDRQELEGVLVETIGE